MPAGMPAIVGEAGLEIFVPNIAGTILSHLDSMKLISTMSALSSVLQPMLTVPSSIMNTTNYNVNVNANYAATQSPVTISQDLDAVLAKARL